MTEDGKAMNQDLTHHKENIQELKDTIVKLEYEIRVLRIEADSERKINAQLIADKENLYSDIRQSKTELDTDRRTNLELNNTVINLNYDIRILKGDHETEKKNLEISSNSLERTKSENKDYIFSIEGLNRKLVEYQNNV